MLTIPIERINLLLDQASQVVSVPEGEPEEDAAVRDSEAAAEGEDDDREEEEDADLAAYLELREMLGDFAPEELCELLALAAIGGSEDGEPSWQRALEQARSVSEEDAISELARVLVATDAIESALEQLGYEIEADDDEDEDEEDEEEDEDEERSRRRS